MTSTNPLPFSQWARIHRNARFISFEPVSGYRIIQREDEGYVIYLPPEATDDEMGQALLNVLDKSRFIWPLDKEFSKWERYVQCERNWQKDFMRRYGYKTKREAYKTMDWCEVTRSEGTISIRPHKRDKPEYWRSLPPDKTVVIPAMTDAPVVGAALRRGFVHCE